MSIILILAPSKVSPTCTPKAVTGMVTSERTPGCSVPPASAVRLTPSPAMFPFIDAENRISSVTGSVDVMITCICSVIEFIVACRANVAIPDADGIFKGSTIISFPFMSVAM